MDPETWRSVGVILMALATGAAGYLAPRILGKGMVPPPPPKLETQQSVIAGVGLEFLNSSNSERIADYLERMTLALEILANIKENERDARIRHLTERLEQALQERSDSPSLRPPPRRRR